MEPKRRDNKNNTQTTQMEERTFNELKNPENIVWLTGWLSDVLGKGLSTTGGGRWDGGRWVVVSGG